MKLNQTLLAKVIDIAEKAGEIILQYYRTGVHVNLKPDDTPVTIADKAADQYICTALASLCSIPYLSEESVHVAYENRKQWPMYWLVDPLDGTKEFIKNTGEFTVNIALIEGNKPVLGVVHLPAKSTTYAAYLGGGAYKSIDNQWDRLPCFISNEPEKLIRVVASRSHNDQATENYIDSLKNKGYEIRLQPAGSSLKFCLVAEGKADCYPRLGPTMEWDIAAAIIICEEAGLSIKSLAFDRTLSFNKVDLLNPEFIVSNNKFTLLEA